MVAVHLEVGRQLLINQRCKGTPADRRSVHDDRATTKRLEHLVDMTLASKQSLHMLIGMSFRDRHGPKKDLPPRTKREDAPEAVRRLLLDLLEEDDEIDSYEVLCAYQDKVPREIWGTDRYEEVTYVIRQLKWWDVYELIERHAHGYSDEDRIEKVFAEAGIAYEYRDGYIVPYEPEAEELEVVAVEDEALRTQDPQHRFADAKDQYRKALDFLRQRPPDLENAVANAVNAVEGAVCVVTGKKSISEGLKTLYTRERSPLRMSIEQLHNYGSAVPGVRHGAHAPSDLNQHEALYVVRAAGSALAYLIAADYEGLFK
jgi:hypothetical protein